MLPRMGWEVPVLYRNGDPDRPLVLGRLYNEASPLPAILPKHSASTCLQSASTRGTSGASGIRMDDTKGKESLGLTASGSQTVVVGGASETTVSGNDSHAVALSYAVKAASQTVTVGGEQSVNVVKNYEVAIGGARIETIGGTESINVTGNRVVQTGAYTESIGAAQATQCIQALLDTQGNLINLVGGALLQTAAAGISEVVTGVRQHTVGAVRAITCANYSESAVGKNILAGPSELVASGPCATTCASGSIDAASLTATASGKVVFEATTLRITADSVTTAGGSIAGGVVKMTGSSLSGTIERVGDSKLGS